VGREVFHLLCFLTLDDWMVIGIVYLIAFLLCFGLEGDFFFFDLLSIFLIMFLVEALLQISLLFRNMDFHLGNYFGMRE
jgi:hypothetical protein